MMKLTSSIGVVNHEQLNNRAPREAVGMVKAAIAITKVPL